MSRLGEALQRGSLALDYDLETRLAEWDLLRRAMVRGVPGEFTRDEWAYLVSFVSREALEDVFRQTFLPPAGAEPSSFFRARGPIAIWLPNNVSLLGPLVLILASFPNADVLVKVGSRSDDLCAAFLRFAIEHLKDGELRRLLSDRVVIDSFDRHDPRNASMASKAAVRIAFGSDAAVTAIHALPHQPGSVAIGFGDHRSEAWVEARAMDDALIMTLTKVFAIYGQAGCTSPRRVVLLGGTPNECRTLRDRMAASWTAAVRRQVPMHVASANVLHAQLNAADGWDIRMAPRHAAVLGVGPISQQEMSGPMSLGIVPGTVDQAIAFLPPNIQTLGVCMSDRLRLLTQVARTRVKRFVPLARMHHFGPVWDGQNFFRQLFEEVPLS